MADTFGDDIADAIVKVWRSDHGEAAEFSIASVDDLHSYASRAFSVLDGAGRISAERRRQIAREGYSFEHECGLGAGQLALAAQAYLTGKARVWPWSRGSLNLSEDHSRNLEMAGALIAAAIDVLKARETNDTT